MKNQKIKPIFAVGIPLKAEPLSNKEAKKIADYICSLTNYEYHVITYSLADNNIKFELFNVEHVDEIKYEELKQIIKDKILN
jgi:hypothetical protein